MSEPIWRLSQRRLSSGRVPCAAASEIDPGAEFRIEMLGAAEGSLRFLTAIERQLERVQTGWGKFPKATSIALALAVFVPTVGVPTYDFYFGDHGLPPADRQRIDELIKIAHSAPGFDAPRRQMFKTLDRDQKITGVGVASGARTTPIIIVPRNQFAEHSGLFQLSAEQVPDERTLDLTLEVTLVSANFENAPRKWLFRQQGMETFSAIMRDKRFLKALIGAKFAKDYGLTFR